MAKDLLTKNINKMFSNINDEPLEETELDMKQAKAPAPPADKVRRKTVEVSMLLENEDNKANMHFDEDYAALLKGMEETGTAKAIEVLEADENGHYLVISGHRRIRAAKELGIEKLPAEIIPGVHSRSEQIAMMSRGNNGRRQKYPYDCALELKTYYEALAEESFSGTADELKELAKKNLLITSSSTFRNYDFLASLPEAVLLLGQDFYITRDEGILLAKALQDEKYAKIADTSLEKILAIQITKDNTGVDAERKQHIAEIQNIIKALDKAMKRKAHDVEKKEKTKKPPKAAAIVSKLNKITAEEKYTIPKSEDERKALQEQVDLGIKYLQAMRDKLAGLAE